VDRLAGRWRVSQEIQQGIRVRARELLNLGEVDCIIGYERGRRGRVRPAFVYDAAGTDRLVWDRTCHHNLTVYLGDQIVKGGDEAGGEGRRVAVVARPCDVRALNVLIHEGQVVRDSVFVIGVACPGMVEGEDTAEHCRRCKERVPVFYDALVGEPPAVDVAPDTWSGWRFGPASSIAASAVTPVARPVPAATASSASPSRSTPPG
jgi:hypothetical protein